MSLQNLVGVSLDVITPQKETVRRLLAGAGRHIADAKVKAVSAETRFSSAYTAIRMLADVGLHANGYIIPESAVAECLSQAESLQTAAVDWLKRRKPDLL
jgi:CBS-domain-containing membrane protein